MSRKMKSVSEIQLHSVPVARSFYPSAAHDRFVAALIVGYDDTDDDAGVKTAQEAAALACSLVHEGGTIWTVLDRETGLWHQWEDAGQERKARPAPAPETTWTCSVCGGTNVQRAVWTNPNTGESGEGVLDGRDSCWCLDCKEHTPLVQTTKPDQDPPAGSEWWIGTAHLPERPADGGDPDGRYASPTNLGLEWQVSDGPAGDRSGSADFDSVMQALVWACKPGVTVHFEADYDPSALVAAHEALDRLCSTIAQTGGMLHGENIGDEPGENDDAPKADPDWVDIGEAYLRACTALGFEPLYSDDKA